MAELLRVVDYSKYQGTVSRASHRLMREDGIAGVVVGLWHGLDANPYALNSLANAKDEGLLRGGYAVVNDRPGRDAVRAAQQAAGGHWPQLFGVAIDVEIRGVTEAILADAFDELERQGQRPLNYTGNWFWNWWALELGHFPDASHVAAWPAYYNGIADLASVPPRPGYGPIVGHQYRGSTSAYGTTVDFNVFDAAWVRAWPQPTSVAQEDEMPLELAQHTQTGAVYAFVGPFKIHLSPLANEAMMARGAAAVRLGDTDVQHNTRLDAMPSFPMGAPITESGGLSFDDAVVAAKRALKEGSG